MTATPSTPDTNDTEPPEFATFLLNHNKGRSHDDLSEKLAALVLAVQESGKPGKLSYTVTIKPQKTEGMVVVIDDIKTAMPKVERPESVFFIGDAGELRRTPANQPSLYDQVTTERPATR